MPEGEERHIPDIPDYVSLPQAVRWVGFALPPLSTRFEFLENYPSITEPETMPEFADPVEWQMEDGQHLGKPEKLSSDSTIDASLRLVLKSLALGEVSARGYISGKGPGDEEYKILKDDKVPAFVWDYRKIKWADFSGAWIADFIEESRFLFFGFRINFYELLERFPSPPYRHGPALPALHVEEASDTRGGASLNGTRRPGPPPAKLEGVKAIAAALLNDRGDDPTAINRALYERNVAAAWDAVYGPGTAPAPKTIRRALNDLAEGERTFVAARAAGWLWED